MSKTTDLIKNTAILGVGRLFGQVAAFIVLPIYTLFLSPEDFGFADLIITYAAILVPTLLLQLDRGAFRLIIDNSNSNKRISQVISSALSIVLKTILVAFALYCVANIWLPVTHFWLILLVIVSQMLSSFSMQVARGFGRNGVYTVGSAINGIVLLGSVMVTLMVLDMKADGVLLSIAFGFIASTLYISTKIRLMSYIGVKHIDSATKKNLLKYSFPLIPSSIAWWVINAADRTIITIFMGLAATGIYAVAFRYSAIFMAIYSVFDMAWTESASRHIRSSDRDAFFSATYNRMLKIFGSLSLVFIAVVPFVFSLLVSDEFSEAYMYMPILIAAAFMNSLVSGYSVIYIATKNTKKVMTTSIMASLVSISLNLLLMPIIGLYAAAIANFIAFGVMAVFRYYDIQKYVRFSYKKVYLLLIALAYVIATTLYYIDMSLLHVVNLCLMVGLLFVLNRAEFAKAIGAIMSRSKG